MEKIEQGCNTQLCESFHSVKMRFAGKSIGWRTSWVARVCAAIFQFNHPSAWIFEVRRRLGLAFMNLDVEKRLISFLKARDIANSKKRNPEIMKSKNKYRMEKRKLEKKEDLINALTKHS